MSILRNRITFREIRAKIINGSLNYIFIERQTKRYDGYEGICSIVLKCGDVYIGGECYFHNLETWIKDDKIRIADGFNIYNQDRFVLIPGSIWISGESSRIEASDIPLGTKLYDGKGNYLGLNSRIDTEEL